MVVLELLQQLHLKDAATKELNEYAIGKTEEEFIAFLSSVLNQTNHHANHI